MVQHPGAKAHDWIKWRVRKGVIPHPNKLACSRCGHTGDYPPHEYHHPNGYEDPSDVIPVCVKCHMSVDGRVKKKGKRCHRLNEQARKDAPDYCKICNRPVAPGQVRKGRCKNCDEYLRKKGFDRPYGSRDGRTARHD